MIKHELMKIKKEGLEAIRAANSTTQGRDVKLVQEINANIVGRSCVIIQNQSVSIDVTNNVLNMISRVDDLLECMNSNQLTAEDLIEDFTGAIEKVNAFMWDHKVSSVDVANGMRLAYLKYCLRENDGCWQKVGDRIGENRTTIREFHKRMIEKKNVREEELCEVEL